MTHRIQNRPEQALRSFGFAHASKKPHLLGDEAFSKLLAGLRLLTAVGSDFYFVLDMNTA
jgi:hypothetical protein